MNDREKAAILKSEAEKVKGTIHEKEWNALSEDKKLELYAIHNKDQLAKA